MCSNDRSEYRHSPDFRSVLCFGYYFSFNFSQAEVVREMWRAWEQGTPEMSQATILDRVGLNAKRLLDVFHSNGQSHPAWKSMIQKGRTRNTYRLVHPDDWDPATRARLDRNPDLEPPRRFEGDARDIC